MMGRFSYGSLEHKRRRNRWTVGSDVFSIRELLGISEEAAGTCTAKFSGPLALNLVEHEVSFR